jgi:hypothetical protein
MANIHGLTLATICAASLAAPVWADEDISGRWRLETGPLRTGCAITGEINFTPAAGEIAYTCRMVTLQDCGSSPNALMFKVEQSCKVQRLDDEFIITGKIEKMLDAGPARMRERLMTGQYYKADNFRVRPVKPDEMEGVFLSLSLTKVRFWREEEKVS